MDTGQKQNIEKYKKLIEDIKVSALITFSETDGLKGRPMSTASVDDEGSIWFFTNEFTEKVEEIAHNNKVLLSYTSMSDNAYVMVNGTGSITDDGEKMKALWNPALKAWFPKGLEDPKMKLLKIIPDTVEYWNGSANKLIFAFEVIKAIAKGETYKDGEHDKIILQ